MTAHNGLPLTPLERAALLFLPASPAAYIYGPYPHGDTRPTPADTPSRAGTLFDLSNRFHALVECVCVDRPGTGDVWRDRQWVLTKEGLAARATEVERSRPAQLDPRRAGSP